jgi:hypothetical protein
LDIDNSRLIKHIRISPKKIAVTLAIGNMERTLSVRIVEEVLQISGTSHHKPMARLQLKSVPCAANQPRKIAIAVWHTRTKALQIGSYMTKGKIYTGTDASGGMCKG